MGHRRHGVSAGDAGRKHRSDNDEGERREALDTVEVVFTSERPIQELKACLQARLRAESWTESLTKQILSAMEDAIRSKRRMGQAMKEVYETVHQKVNDFVHKHPVFAACIVPVFAIAILVFLLPWVVEALGFGSRGPVAGEPHLSKARTSTCVGS